MVNVVLPPADIDALGLAVNVKSAIAPVMVMYGLGLVKVIAELP